MQRRPGLARLVRETRPQTRKIEGMDTADTPRAQAANLADTGLRLVLTTLPDAASAAHVARVLVDERLAACVTVLGPATSVYRWQGTVASAQEAPLLIKVAAERLPSLQERLLQLHPYDLPELIALPVVDGLGAYIDWALAASRPG